MEIWKSYEFTDSPSETTDRDERAYCVMCTYIYIYTAHAKFGRAFGHCVVIILGYVCNFFYFFYEITHYAIAVTWFVYRLTDYRRQMDIIFHIRGDHTNTCYTATMDDLYIIGNGFVIYRGEYTIIYTIV